MPAAPPKSSPPAVPTSRSAPAVGVSVTSTVTLDVASPPAPSDTVTSKVAGPAKSTSGANVMTPASASRDTLPPAASPTAVTVNASPLRSESLPTRSATEIVTASFCRVSTASSTAAGAKLGTSTVIVSTLLAVSPLVASVAVAVTVTSEATVPSRSMTILRSVN